MWFVVRLKGVVSRYGTNNYYTGIRGDGTVSRQRARLKSFKYKYSRGLIAYEHIRQSIQSHYAHIAYADTYKLRQLGTLY